MNHEDEIVQALQKLDSGVLLSKEESHAVHLFLISLIEDNEELLTVIKTAEYYLFTGDADAALETLESVEADSDELEN